MIGTHNSDVFRAVYSSIRAICNVLAALVSSVLINTGGDVELLVYHFGAINMDSLVFGRVMSFVCLTTILNFLFEH